MIICNYKILPKNVCPQLRYQPRANRGAKALT